MGEFTVAPVEYSDWRITGAASGAYLLGAPVRQWGVSPYGRETPPALSTGADSQLAQH